MSIAPSTSTTEGTLTPGAWTLDQHHSAVTFSIRHLGLSRIRGRFDRFTAALDAGASISASRVSVTIDVASVNTNDPDRDAHLRSTEFFSADQHPEIRFNSTGISGAGERWDVSGDLTLNGVTQPITFDVEFHGVETFPLDQKRHLGFTATGALRRSVYGIELGLVPLSSNKLMLDDDVKIEIDAQFIEPEITL